MRRVYDFYKESSGNWYIDLPNYPGPKADLQMVGGADEMLDMISEGEERVAIYISDVNSSVPKDCDKLIFKGKSLVDGGGANYTWNKMNVWLCPVTKFVFGDYPKTIYIKVI